MLEIMFKVGIRIQTLDGRVGMVIGNRPINGCVHACIEFNEMHAIRVNAISAHDKRIGFEYSPTTEWIDQNQLTRA